MAMKRIALVVLALVNSAFAFEVPSLEREDAKATLESMGWKEVTVVAVLQGVDDRGTAAPIYSTVMALATRDGHHQGLRQTFFFDKQYGWFFYELGEKKARIWSKAGFQEIVPWST